MDTTQMFVDYLYCNLAFEPPVNGPFGYLPPTFERVSGKLQVLCNANIFQSIVQVTKSDIVWT